MDFVHFKGVGVTATFPKRVGQAEDLVSELKSCGHHPGMSCAEVHLDDKMLIGSLREEIEKLNKDGLLNRAIVDAQKKHLDYCVQNHRQDEKLDSDLRALGYDPKELGNRGQKLAMDLMAKQYEKQIETQQMTIDSQAKTIAAWTKTAKELRERNEKLCEANKVLFLELSLYHGTSRHSCDDMCPTKKLLEGE